MRIRSVENMGNAFYAFEKYRQISGVNPIDEDQGCGRGPIGKGDPDDFTLRPKELLLNIPALQIQAAMQFKCKHLKEELEECADSSYIARMSCSEESRRFLDCVNYWSDNEEFKEQMTQEYLKIRQEYRNTGRRRLYRALKGETYVAPDKLKGLQV